MADSHHTRSDSHNDKQADSSTLDAPVAASGASGVDAGTESVKGPPGAIVAIIVYGVMAILAALAVFFVAVASPAAQVVSQTSPESGRDALGWSSPPSEMLPIWSTEGYTGIVDTPGAMVGMTESGLHRLDSSTGEVIWAYDRPGKLCDAIVTGGNITAVFDPGNGCTDLVTLNSATGEYINQARYITDSGDARLVEGIDGHIALVTRSMVRVLRNDLVSQAEFGMRPDPAYADDQEVEGCHVYDVAMGPRHAVIAAQCAGDSTTHVRAIEIDPDRSNSGEVILDVDTGQAVPVTLPAVSISMVVFVVPGANPAAYVWQLDKDEAEVARHPLGPSEFGMGYLDVPGIGYIWRIGPNVHVRWGSEDLSKSVERGGAIGNPMVANKTLLIPRYNSVLAWDDRAGFEKEIQVDGLTGSEFAFSGYTIAAFNPDNGVITAYA